MVLSAVFNIHQIHHKRILAFPIDRKIAAQALKTAILHYN